MNKSMASLYKRKAVSVRFSHTPVEDVILFSIFEEKQLQLL
jgi:hypothetical protein